MLIPNHQGGFLMSFLLCWMLSFSQMVISQPIARMEDTLSQQQFIKGCALYRHQFIDNITRVLTEFGALSDSLKALSENPEVHDEFRDLFMRHVLRSEFQDLKGTIGEDLPAVLLKEKEACKAYKAWAKENTIQIFQFNFLLVNEIIVPDQPFRLTSLQHFWSEVQMYDLKAGQTFVDVGAGIGIVSFILAGSGLPLNIYMTEINQTYLEFLHQQLENGSVWHGSSQLIATTSHKKDLGLGYQVQADRILMREVFHHLGHQDEMLASVKAHLKKDGLLILVESVKELNAHNKANCYKAMELKKILVILDKNGFELKQKKRVGDSYVMQFTYR